MAGLALCAGVLTGVVQTEEASALGTVTGATVAVVAMANRRPPRGPSQGDAATLDE